MAILLILVIAAIARSVYCPTRRHIGFMVCCLQLSSVGSMYYHLVYHTGRINRDRR